MPPVPLFVRATLVALAAASVSAQRDTPAVVLAPVFDHISARYANLFWLSVSAAPGATVRFTIDGSTPTAGSPVFDVPRLIDGRVTVKARAFVDGRPPSVTTTGHFVVELPRRASPPLHVVPTTYRDDPSGFRDACLRMDQWPEVLSRTTSFGSTMGLARLADEELTACFRRMAKARLQLTIELGVVNDDVTDARTLAAGDTVALRRFLRLGAPLRTLFLQAPWTSTSPSRLSYGQVVDETASWIAGKLRDLAI